MKARNTDPHRNSTSRLPAARRSTTPAETTAARAIENTKFEKRIVSVLVEKDQRTDMTRTEKEVVRMEEGGHQKAQFL
jgi:hypothetical protein